jgi:hypothetical protein
MFLLKWDLLYIVFLGIFIGSGGGFEGKTIDMVVLKRLSE